MLEILAKRRWSDAFFLLGFPVRLPRPNNIFTLRTSKTQYHPHRNNCKRIKVKIPWFRLFSLLNYESESERKSLGFSFLLVSVACCCGLWLVRAQHGRLIFIHLQCREVLPFGRFQRQRCIKIRVLRPQDFYTPLALKTAKGQHLPALEVYKNQSPTT